MLETFKLRGLNCSLFCKLSSQKPWEEPLQFYWFQAAVRIYNALLCSNCSTLAKVLKADIAMSTINKKCWSAEFLDAFHGLERSCHAILCLCRIGVWDCVFEIRQLLVGDT